MVCNPCNNFLDIFLLMSQDRFLCARRHLIIILATFWQNASKIPVIQPFKCSIKDCSRQWKIVSSISSFMSGLQKSVCTSVARIPTVSTGDATAHRDTFTILLLENVSTPKVSESTGHLSLRTRNMTLLCAGFIRECGIWEFPKNGVRKQFSRIPVKWLLHLN